MMEKKEEDEGIEVEEIIEGKEGNVNLEVIKRVVYKKKEVD